MYINGRYDEVCLNPDTVLAEVNKWQEIVQIRESIKIVGIFFAGAFTQCLNSIWHVKYPTNIYLLYDSKYFPGNIDSDLTIGVYGKIMSTGNLFLKGSSTIHTPSLPPSLYNTSINVINTHGKCAFFSSMQNNSNTRDFLMYLLKNCPMTYRVIFPQKLNPGSAPAMTPMTRRMLLAHDSSYTKWIILLWLVLYSRMLTLYAND